MGCDIHLNAELFTRKRWITLADPIKQCWSCKGKGKTSRRTMDGSACTVCEGKGEMKQEWYEGRNYTLFSILADVRNDGSITPISGPRGLPKDVSKQSKHAHGGDHSHSWLGLDEVINWEGWDCQTITDTVWLDPKGYALLLAERAGTAKPGPHLDYAVPSSRTFDGGGWVDLTNAEMQSVADSGVWLPKHRTKVTTEIPLRAIARIFFKQTVQPLSKLARKREITDAQIRLVFSFDS